MNITTALIIIAVAALVHASFQLSISMLTLLSSHTIGKKRSQGRLLLLTHSFAFGVAVMTILLLCLLALLFNHAGAAFATSLLTWTVVCGLLAGVGLSVMIFYYRREFGTTLWVPRGIALYLSERTKKTKQSAEAFSLGLTSVVGELLFIIAPLLVAALVLVGLEPQWQLAGIALYAVVSLSSLLLVTGLVGGGHSISRIQKWREENKRFLQFASGTGLLALGFYVYVEQVMLTNALAAAGGV